MFFVCLEQGFVKGEVFYKTLACQNKLEINNLNPIPSSGC